MKKVFRKLRFNNVKIGTKYGIILGIVLFLFILSALIVYQFLRDIDTQIDAVDRRGERAVSVAEMGSLLRAKNTQIYAYLLESTPEVEAAFSERKDTFEELESALESRMDTEEEQELFYEIVRLDELVNRSFNEVVSYTKQGEEAVASAIAMDATNKQSQAVNLIEELKLLVNDQRDVAIDNAKASQLSSMIALFAAIIGSFIISIILMVIVNRVISRSMNEVVQMSNQIADGNLRVASVKYNGEDEIGQLASSMNTMSSNLRIIIQQVLTVSHTVSTKSEELNQSSIEVKTGTEQIAITMQELASGSETQANHASEAAAKMSDFSNKVSEANQNGNKIESVSTNVLSMTEEGSGMMDSSVGQMARIHTIVQDAVNKVRGLDDQTKQISKLVAVIKDIAEQTNLLALNAAIESARAGEHGKGFAVVADEVRKLAEQVANSVTDITRIVTNIQQESSDVTKSLENGYNEVENGSIQIERTGETFNQINSSIRDMVESIQTVTGNLEAISVTSDEINKSIEEIASISEESAAGVEQTSASAQQASSSMEEISSSSNELASLAEELNNLISKFKI
ncbi:methyl-accepting chemotaxis protein [Gracilibacillus oryzae]|uniref:Methyl-accepting chemotaxis protein n=1 Tax=Gracilibacillus oryzae TaxID=1672701 RepID=A0A7C8GQK8_9BACI|nr:methyl-accepting chemotaxis protein [Gracilibacillus oryzae]KAB8125854.1 methyl-accepting chemotaxis protein [Gracilibacillus oryzae]